MASRSNKRIKLSADDGSSVFGSLNEDCLRAVLVRTCASDHNSLLQTCKRFCKVLNSFSFRQERALLGYTEVQGVEILSPLEQYKEDYSFEEEEDNGKTLSSQDSTFQQEYDEVGQIGEYGEHRLTGTAFKILVDGKELCMKSLQVYLLPRCRRWDSFFEMCDNLNGTLGALSMKCFNKRGKPRLQSLKAAIPVRDNRPLLYISEFELPEEYRNLKCTVGPVIIQSILTQVPLLKDRWSVAMYVPCDKAQFTKQDKGESMKIRDMTHFMRTTPLSEEEKQVKKDWYDRLEVLAQQDMRQFFRAGFHQISDSTVVENSDFYIAYATPDLLQAGLQRNKSILSEQEVMQVEILTPPPDPPAKSDEESALFDLMRDSSSHRLYLIKEIEDLQNPPRKIRKYMGLYYQFDQRIALESIQEVLGNSIEQQWHRMVTAEVEAELAAKVKEMASEELMKLKEELSNYDKQVKLDLNKLMATNAAPKDATQLILKSDAIHACACYMAQPYVHLLLDLLPTDKKRIALDFPDGAGSTPLMIAAASGRVDVYDHKRYEMCAFLINQGADKDYQNREGFTALGALRQAVCSNSDREAVFGRHSDQVEADDQLVRDMLTLLTPINGPSTADEEVMEGNDSDDEREEFSDEEVQSEDDEEEDEDHDNEDGTGGDEDEIEDDEEIDGRGDL